MRNLLKVLVLSACSLSATFAYAVDGMNFTLGGGDESATMIEASAKWNWDSKWFTDGDWYVGGYWELGAGHWDGKRGDTRNSDITYVGLTPVFRLTRHQPLSNGVRPFLEGAVGFQLMSDHKIGDKDLGGDFIFRDHVSGGVMFGNNEQHELSLKLQHFSNAGLNKSNPGINFMSLQYGYNY